MRSHFRSRDKDGGHTIRSAIAENLVRELALGLFWKTYTWCMQTSRLYVL